MDTIGNMLTTLVNAQRARKKRVAVPYSAYKKELLALLADKGVIAGVRVQESPKARLVVTLAYDDQRPRLTGAKRISRPGRKMYARHNEIPYTYQGYGFIVLSTSKGVMDEAKARREKTGGELVCAIW
jgi:small subunit ribosomal protein S8